MYRDKKYLICPGYVISSSDGDQHYISAGQLMSLYKVHPNDCVIYNPAIAGFHGNGWNELIILRPQGNGNYELPDSK